MFQLLKRENKKKTIFFKVFFSFFSDKTQLILHSTNMYKQVPLVQSKNGYNVKSVQKYENLSLEPRSDNAVSAT
jgi:hypothetical protein